MRSTLTMLGSLQLVALWMLAPRTAAQTHWVRSGTLLPEEGYVATQRHFGWDYSVVGDWVLVAAPPIAGGSSEGIAYVYEGTGSDWRLDQALSAPAGTPEDDFARSTALAPGWAWIGAPGERDRAGAAYLFEHQGSGWVRVLRYAPPVHSDHDELGATVAIRGGRALVSAPGDGAVHILENDGGTWTTSAVLRPPAGEDPQDFGRALAQDDSRVFVGSPKQGAVYVFNASSGTWSLESLLLPSASASAFGSALALEGSTLVVGAPHDENQGQVFVFEHDTAWTQSACLVAPGISPAHSFGASVSLAGSVLVAGAPGEDRDFGSMSLFERRPHGWVTAGRFSADPQDGDGRFAYHVAVCPDMLMGNIGLNDTGVIAYLGAIYVWTPQPVVTPSHVARSAGPGSGPPRSHVALEVDAGPGSAGRRCFLVTWPATIESDAMGIGSSPEAVLRRALRGTVPALLPGLLDARGHASFALSPPACLAGHRLGVAAIVLDGGPSSVRSVSAPLMLTLD